MLIAEYWADWLGIELNQGKREEPLHATRHLGFFVDLKEKMIAVTDKHRIKIVTIFNRCLATMRSQGRLPVKDLQRMLGLQIWISTVFRIARQFLTSTCDLLRVANTRAVIYPRRHHSLIARVIFDLKFWRRFVLSRPKTSFDALLNRLPLNGNKLASDASAG